MSRFLRYMKTKIKNNPSRLISCIPLGYTRSMDDLDFYIEDTLNGKIKLAPETQNALIEKVWMSHDVSVAQRLTEETRYYNELLSRLTKTYGH